VCEIFGKWWIFLRRIFNSLSATVNHRFIVFFQKDLVYFFFLTTQKKDTFCVGNRKRFLSFTSQIAGIICGRFVQHLLVSPVM